MENAVVKSTVREIELQQEGFFMTVILNKKRNEISFKLKVDITKMSEDMKEYMISKHGNVICKGCGLGDIVEVGTVTFIGKGLIPELMKNCKLLFEANVDTILLAKMLHDTLEVPEVTKDVKSLARGSKEDQLANFIEVDSAFNEAFESLGIEVETSSLKEFNKKNKKRCKSSSDSSRESFREFLGRFSKSPKSPMEDNSVDFDEMMRKLLNN